MDRRKLLAAEIYGYSFAAYADHLGIGNERYERLMPHTVEMLETAEREGWSPAKIAAELDMDVEEVAPLLEAFRHGVRCAIMQALDAGLDGPEAIENLVTQICFRAADLAFLLEQDGTPLSRYSRHLRREPGVEYYEGYFDA